MYYYIWKSNPCIISFHQGYDAVFLESEPYVTVTLVEGMKEIENDPANPFRLRSISRYSAELVGVDSTSFSDYRWGGYVREVKRPQSLQFHSFEQSSYNNWNKNNSNNNNHTVRSSSNVRTANQLHLAFLGVLEYLDKHHTYPVSYCEVAYPLLFYSIRFYSIRFR